MPQQNNIWTIGHSTRTAGEFIALLKSFDIEVLADVRHYPGSRRYPHFNKEQLQKSLEENNIEYIHLVDLGGRRKPLKDSSNTAWRNDAFRGYADYMQTRQFKNALEQLKEIASTKRTACMCSEAVWWRCHRSLVSDQLKTEGWNVQHIMDIGKASEHKYTAPARIVDGKLTYSDPELF